MTDIIRSYSTESADQRFTVYWNGDESGETCDSQILTIQDRDILAVDVSFDEISTLKNRTHFLEDLSVNVSPALTPEQYKDVQYMIFRFMWDVLTVFFPDSIHFYFDDTDPEDPES